jgi:hypothetical protein
MTVHGLQVRPGAVRKLLRHTERSRLTRDTRLKINIFPLEARELAEPEPVLSAVRMSSAVAWSAFCSRSGPSPWQRSRSLTSSGHLHLRSTANGGNELDDANPWGKAAVGK